MNEWMLIFFFFSVEIIIWEEQGGVGGAGGDKWMNKQKWKTVNLASKDV